MGQLSTPQQWRCSWNTDDKVTLNHQILSYKDIATLDDSEQLNDEILLALLTLLVNQNNSGEILLHNTFFYEKLLSRDGLLRTLKWTKNIQVEKLKYMVIPIHRPNHWVVAILVVSETQASTNQAPPTKSATIITIDSLDCKGTSENEDIFLQLRNYLTTLIESLDSDAVEWKHARGFARQSNSYDCGIYVLLAVEEFLQRPEAFIRRFCDASEAPNNVIFDSLKGRHRFQDLIIQLKKKHDASLKKIVSIEDLTENETRVPILMRLNMGSAMKAFGFTQDIENCNDYLVDSDQWNLIFSAEAGTDFSALIKYESEQPSNNGSSAPARGKWNCPRDLLGVNKQSGFHPLLEEKKLRDREWDDVSVRMHDLHNTLAEQLQSAQDISTVLTGLVEVVERQLKVWKSRFQQDMTKLASDNLALADSVAEKTQMLERHANASLLVNLLESEKRKLESEIRRMEEVDDTELQRITMRKRRRFMSNHKT